MAARVFTFNPSSAEEAASILRACTRLAGEGRKIGVAIVESPDAGEWSGGQSGARAGGDAFGRAVRQSTLEELEALPADEAARVVLSHSAMNRVREISKEDFLAVVDGGVRFRDFAAAVREAGLHFPHEASEETKGMTIARLIMSGTKFPTEEHFGRFREHILALELVIPKGEIIRAGSRSVKDVTGYDLIGFAMGAGSRCGMIARATLRLLPLPFDALRTSAGLGTGGPQGTDAASPAAGTAMSRFEDRASRSPVLRGLDERVYEVLDPAGLMKSTAPGV